MYEAAYIMDFLSLVAVSCPSLKVIKQMFLDYLKGMWYHQIRDWNEKLLTYSISLNSLEIDPEMRIGCA